jgi:hypothetical protein
MKKNNCELIRRELDELMLEEEYSSAAASHLRECASCREFYEQQAKLRQIVGSLGTVEAPADFDFRLRARLANDSNGMASFYWPLLKRGFAVAGLLLVFAAAAVLVRNVINRSAGNDDLAAKGQPAAVPQSTTAPQNSAPQRQENVVAEVPEKRSQIIKNPSSSAAGFKAKRTLGTWEASSLRAEVINGAEPVGTSAAFPIDVASLQSFKVSLDDGRGNEKTISVPTISFGSQRIVQTANQYAPKRIW